MTVDVIKAFKEALEKVAAKKELLPAQQVPMVISRYMFEDGFALAKKLQEQLSKSNLQTRRLLY